MQKFGEGEKYCIPKLWIKSIRQVKRGHVLFKLCRRFFKNKNSVLTFFLHSPKAPTLMTSMVRPATRLLLLQLSWWRCVRRCVVPSVQFSSSHRWTCVGRYMWRRASGSRRPCTAACNASSTERSARRPPSASTTSDAFDSVRSTSTDDCAPRNCHSSTSPSDPRTLTHTRTHADFVMLLSDLPNYAFWQSVCSSVRHARLQHWKTKRRRRTKIGVYDPQTRNGWYASL